MGFLASPPTWTSMVGSPGLPPAVEGVSIVAVLERRLLLTLDGPGPGPGPGPDAPPTPAPLTPIPGPERPVPTPGTSGVNTTVAAIGRWNVSKCIELLRRCVR
jgi:hypothetical protein